MNSWFIRGNAAWDAGDLQSAIACFQKGAQEGDWLCQNSLGVFFEGGYACTKNIATAIKWYKAAFRNDPKGPSAFNIGTAYVKQKNQRQAELWLRRAIENGDPEAALALAKFQISRDFVRYRKPAEDLLRMVQRSDSVIADAKEEADQLMRRIQKR